jgi:hypothetical protein
MALYIRDDSVRAMAQRLAEKRRTTVTEVVRQALEREVKEIEADIARREAVMRELHAKWLNEPPIQEWGDEQMYDEDGVPK